jgi:DNA-binding transcriptional ArsR family regulator
MGLLTDILKGLPENAVLRDKVAEAEKRYGALETENAILKDDLYDAKTEITKLKKQVEEFTHKGSELNDLEIKLLQLLSDPICPNNAEWLSSSLGEKLPRVQHHLERLEAEGYVISVKAFIPGMRIPYCLNPKAREYLVRNDLLL